VVSKWDVEEDLMHPYVMAVLADQRLAELRREGRLSDPAGRRWRLRRARRRWREESHSS